MSRGKRKGWHNHRRWNSVRLPAWMMQLMNGVDTMRLSADDLGDIRQDQQQCRGEENESGLANFRMFEHG